jgi:hypothetical protein
MFLGRHPYVCGRAGNSESGQVTRKQAEVGATWREWFFSSRFTTIVWPTSLPSPGASMTKKRKTKKPGVVEKIIKQPSQPEKAQITLVDGDDLYKEIRIENKVNNENGEPAKLKPGAVVDVIVEADEKDTVPATEGERSNN